MKNLLSATVSVITMTCIGLTALLPSFAFAEVEDFAPVTDEMLREPEPDDWLMWRRTYDGWAYSPLDEINRENVSALQLAWSWAMEPGPQQTTPLVYNGVMYLTHPEDVIQALDARTGDLIWEYRRELPEDVGEGLPFLSLGDRNRNIAIYQDKILHATFDAHVIALDARTGALVWETQVGDYRDMTHSGGPIIIDGKAITGRTCTTAYPDCFVAAHDIETGEELWRTFLIPRPGEYGFDTWGDVPPESRFHVGAWNPGSYDPELHLYYQGTSVPAPSPEILRGTGDADMLYSNSTLALDPDTGEIVWYFQHAPRDNWDLDHPFDRILVDTVVAPDPDEVPWINPNVAPGEERRVLTGIPGKTGIVWTLDRATGEFLWARETTYQNVYPEIEPETGRALINEDVVFEDIFDEFFVCPSFVGGKDWPAGAYSPLTNAIYQPLSNTCFDIAPSVEEATPEDGYAIDATLRHAPDSGEQVGRVDAVSVETGQSLWRYEQRAPTAGSLLTTGGGLVFGGDANRRFRAFDQESGEILWETIVSSQVGGHPISYSVDGKQYVAVPVGPGLGGFMLSLTPEIQVAAGNAIFVFALPD